MDLNYKQLSFDDFTTLQIDADSVAYNIESGLYYELPNRLAFEVGRPHDDGNDGPEISILIENQENLSRAIDYTVLCDKDYKTFVLFKGKFYDHIGESLNIKDIVELIVDDAIETLTPEYL